MCMSPQQQLVSDSACLQERGAQHLIWRLPKALGYGVGLELMESGSCIEARDSGAHAQAGMVFYLQLGGGPPRSSRTVALAAAAQHQQLMPQAVPALSPAGSRGCVDRDWPTAPAGPARVLVDTGGCLVRRRHEAAAARG